MAQGGVSLSGLSKLIICYQAFRSFLGLDLIVHNIAMVGLPDKAVSEAKERVRAALVASGLALPARRITVNLAPADLPKEGSHYDLPIALGLMAEIAAIPPECA